MKTEKTDIAKILRQLPDATKRGRESRLEGPSRPTATRIAEQILEGGDDSLADLVNRVRDEAGNDETSYRPGLAIRILGSYALEAKQPEVRRSILKAISRRALDEEAPAGARRFLVRELHALGDGSVVEPLGTLLDDEDLYDCAVEALVAIGPTSTPVLRQALGSASGGPLTAIIQALGELRDDASASSIAKSLASGDSDTRLAAALALARIGAQEAVERVLQLADSAAGWERVQATKACLLLAESLGAKDRTAASRRIYSHLRDTRTKPEERYVRDLAEAALADA